MSLPLVTELSRVALYMRPSCPYCVRVTDFCQSNDLQIENRNISEGAHLEALMVGGGKRQVPCLRIADDEGQSYWLYDSMDIINYIKAQFPR
jgi:glutaredoxin